MNKKTEAEAIDDLLGVGLPALMRSTTRRLVLCTIFLTVYYITHSVPYISAFLVWSIYIYSGLLLLVDIANWLMGAVSRLFTGSEKEELFYEVKLSIISFIRMLILLLIFSVVYFSSEGDAGLVEQLLSNESDFVAILIAWAGFLAFELLLLLVSVIGRSNPHERRENNLEKVKVQLSEYIDLEREKMKWSTNFGHKLRDDFHISPQLQQAQARH